jgi:hypothetical protein
MISAMQNLELHTRLQNDLMIDRWEKWYASNSDEESSADEDEADNDE